MRCSMIFAPAQRGPSSSIERRGLDLLTESRARSAASPIWPCGRAVWPGDISNPRL